MGTFVKARPLIKELSPEKLRKECEPSVLQCGTTMDLQPLEEIIGQDRAVKALKFGLDIKEKGFNVYVAGYPGTGRMSAVKDFLEDIAKKKPAPSDLCYAYNFRNSYEPKAFMLPPGTGKHFKADMANFVNEAKRVLPQVFESDDYNAKRESTVSAVEVERQKLLVELNKKAQEQGFLLQATRIGLLAIPIVNGKPIDDQAFMALSPKAREEIQQRREKFDIDLRGAMRELRQLEVKANDQIKKLNHEVALFAIGNLMSELKEEYKKFPEVVSYIDDLQNDLLENLPAFLRVSSEATTAAEPQFPWMRELPYRKYEVNVIVDNSGLQGAPVIVELNPSYQNLFGRIEKEAQFGVLTTDFTMIRAGSMHKAIGGYLILRAEELLRNELSWESLKMALSSGQMNIEEPGERFGYITIKGLKPEPIPLAIKVILIGSPMLHQLLFMYDTDFTEMFKVKADFDTTMDRTKENMEKYAGFICAFCRRENMKHLEASAIAKIVEFGSRLVEDQEKLSTRFAEIADVVREANFYAIQEKSELITGEHIKKAIEEKIYRSNLIEQKIQEMFQRGFFLIDIEGETVGQVNGLSVIGLGDIAFGRPSRVTASIGIGREGIIDIERRAKLGGPTHTKGVLILSGYLTEKYAQDKPLSLSARLVFEQSYEEVEGDSASSTELYAILSALSGIPIKQNFAVTGSVNQKGEVQAIGGVNEKIEGFFEICKLKGLTGKQGVLIPESNVQNLMLKEEVVNAVKAGKFHIYPIKTIDEGISFLTGVEAGNRKSDGTFEKDTVNYLADKRLREIAQKLSEFPEFTIEKK